MCHVLVKIYQSDTTEKVSGSDMTRLMLQVEADKLPLAMLHSFVCLARHHFGTGLDARCNLTPAPLALGRRMSCSHLAPAHCNEGIRLLDRLPDCLLVPTN